MVGMYGNFGVGKGSHGNRGIELLQKSMHLTRGMQLTTNFTARGKVRASRGPPNESIITVYCLPAAHGETKKGPRPEKCATLFRVTAIYSKL